MKYYLSTLNVIKRNVFKRKKYISTVTIKHNNLREPGELSVCSPEKLILQSMFIWTLNCFCFHVLTITTLPTPRSGN